MPPDFSSGAAPLCNSLLLLEHPSLCLTPFKISQLASLYSRSLQPKGALEATRLALLWHAHLPALSRNVSPACLPRISLPCPLRSPPPHPLGLERVLAPPIRLSAGLPHDSRPAPALPRPALPGLPRTDPSLAAVLCRGIPARHTRAVPGQRRGWAAPAHPLAPSTAGAHPRLRLAPPPRPSAPGHPSGAQPLASLPSQL